MTRRTLLLPLALLASVAAGACLAAGCGPARRGAPHTAELVASDPVVALGEQAFALHCHQCHPGGTGGLGPAINDKPLPVNLIKTQVRQGLGDMPGFSQDQLTDEQLDAIATYLKALRSLPQVARN